mgnify:CR=1 FL=1
MSEKNPKEQFEKNLKELNEKIPEMNGDISSLKDQLISLKSELDYLSIQEKQLKEKQEIALKTNQESLQKSIDDSIHQITTNLKKREKDIYSLEKNYDNSLKNFNVYITEKTKEFQHIINFLEDNIKQELIYKYSKFMKSILHDQNDFQSHFLNDMEVALQKLHESCACVDEDLYKERMTRAYLSIDEIRNMLNSIDASSIQEEMKEIIALSELIMDDINNHPEDIHKARMFLTYYLGSIKKVINGYIRLSKSTISTDTIKTTITKAEELISLIKTAFQKLHEELLEHDAVNLDTEIAVLEKELNSK